jgi:CheY-like chemotaxis protein
VEDLGSPLKGNVILLVEDSELNILVARKFLEEWGAEIEVANNGLEALELFDESKHHLILMDLNMPVMDGYTATAELRKRGVTKPIIALTASIPTNEKDDILTLGCDDIVLKPFNPNVFINTLLLHLKPKSELAVVLK